jgi:hypothetical protein
MSFQSENGRSAFSIVESRAYKPDVPLVSQKPTSPELIDADELARRLNLPVSWVRSHTRQRTSDEIPTVRFGRYCRFDWNSSKLQQWIRAHEVGRG